MNRLALGADMNTQVAACFAEEHALYGRFYLVKLGKKNYQLFERV